MWLKIAHGDLSCGAVLILANSQSIRQDSAQIVMLLIVLLAIILAVAGAGALAHRQMMRQDKTDAAAETFSLSDLRQLHRDGQMTDEEYEKAKALVIEETRTVLDDDFEDDSFEDTGPEVDGNDVGSGPQNPTADN